MPLVVLPFFEGNTQGKSVLLQNANLLESASCGYSGLLAALLAAPLAWCNRRRRAAVWFWTALGVFALGWTLNVPGLVHVLRLPGLNFLSWNRFVFVTAFAVMTLAVIGLEELWAGWPEWRRGFAGPVILLEILGFTCAYLAFWLPDAIARMPLQLQPKFGIHELQRGFREYYLYGVVLCGLSLGGWWLVRVRRGSCWSAAQNCVAR